MPTLDKTIAHLDRLRVICLDGQRACRQLAASARAAQLRYFLNEREREYSALGACLHTQIATYGGRPARRVSLAGVWQRCWQALKSLLAPVDDRARLRAVLRQENRTRRGFEAVLGQELSPDFQRQLAEHHQRALARARQIGAALAHWPRLDALERQ